MACSSLAALVLLTSPAAGAAPAKFAEDKGWRVELKAPAEVKAGQPFEVKVELVAREGFHVNAEYPLHFKAKGEGVTPTKPRVDRADGLVEQPCAKAAEDRCSAVLPVKYATAGAGPAKVQGTFAFSVCNPDQCLIKKVDLEAPVEVKAP